MHPISELRRRGRRAVLAKLGAYVFDHKAIQQLLGFVKSKGHVIETFDHLEIEYEYASAIGRSLFFAGRFEQAEIEFFARLIASAVAPIVLDVGANIGLHSLHWAVANPHAAVYAFEPCPATREILQRNVHRNSLQTSVTIVPHAVSSQSGQAQFFACADSAFSSLKDTHRERVIEIIDVAVTTVDDFVADAGLTRLFLIKIDVEGFEKEVILGAMNALQRFRPDLFVEIYRGTHSNPDPEGTVQLLSALGYRPYVFKDGTLFPYEGHVNSQYNYYFTSGPAA